MTLLSRVRAGDEEVTVLTKVKYLFVFNRPRTSIMPRRAAELASRGVQFLWRTSSKEELNLLHNIILESIAEGLSLDELRAIANLGKPLVALGLPLVHPEAPISTSLKKLGNQMRAVI